MRVIATAGHVDHGKSSLVRALTGTDPDRWEEERRRGLTIDLGFAHTTVADDKGQEDISFVDVPGHVRFLRNMLAGVGGVDACLFVVAATEGWKPQSEEHLRILELVGVRHGIIALTKVDVLDDPELVELATLEVSERVAGTFLGGAPVVPVAAPSGHGVDRLMAELAGLARATPASTDRARPRLWIDRVFGSRGSGTVVTGTLIDGSLATDQTVLIEPHHRTARIRTMQSHGRIVDAIGPGNRVALNLAGVDRGELARGDVVVTPGRWQSSRMVDASLTVLPTLDHVVSRRGAYLAYVGSGEHAVRVRVLGSEALPPGAAGVVRLHLAVALPLLPGDHFVLRETGRDETVGGGEVLDVAPVRTASRARPDRNIDRVIAERGWVTVDDLERLTGARREPTVGQWIVAPQALEAVRASIRTQLDAAEPAGVELSAFDDRQRAVLDTLDDVVVTGTMVRLASGADPLVDHPVLAKLATGGLAPPAPTGAQPAELRELARRGLLVERDGLWFHSSAIDTAARLVAALLADQPEGVAVSAFREAAGITRKHAVPLLAELDARGVTRRRGDVRIGGPRLPA
ncbi:MAG: selenocysteine-specific translation elongation factor, partial [Ilumatobacteraceae bacterium]